MENPKEKRKHFVLIHGVCHGSWCWYKVKMKLELAGHQVTTLDMAASGMDTKSIQDVTTVAEYTKPLLEFMDELPSDDKVVLVGHSFGGINISLAMDEFPEKISVAVFLTALMPDVVNPPSYVLEQIRSQVYTEAFEWMDTIHTTHESLGETLTMVSFGPEFMKQKMYQNSPTEDLELALKLTRPGPVYILDLSRKEKLKAEGYGSVKRVYVVCGEDLSITKEIQYWMITNYGRTIDTMVIPNADHMPMFSKPDELTRLAHLAGPNASGILNPVNLHILGDLPKMAHLLGVPTQFRAKSLGFYPDTKSSSSSFAAISSLKKKSIRPVSASMSVAPLHTDAKSSNDALKPTVLVNSCTGKMGKSVIEAAVAAGLDLVPVSFGVQADEGKVVNVAGKEIKVHGTSGREDVLKSVLDDHPDLIVVDYTVPDAVNGNAELYSKMGVPFVMGTTGGDREKLMKTVHDSNLYAVISPQMGKQVVAFLAAMEIMAEQFPGALSGYSMQVLESHQFTKLDTSGTAKAFISCFQKLGVSFDMDEVQLIRDPKLQLEMVGVPEEHLGGHAFHMYHITSPDQTVSFEFQHNVCGRSIYAEGTVDAVLFLAKKIKAKDHKRIYNMVDVLREGNLR